MKPVVVVDASVSVKWFLSTSPEDVGTHAALGLLQAYGNDRLDLYQPPIWRAEVLGVLARVVPATAVKSAARLLSFDYKSADSREVYQKAIELSVELNHHLFDTMYHAAALVHPSAVFVTADERYRVKGERLGRILALTSWKDIFQ